MWLPFTSLLSAEYISFPVARCLGNLRILKMNIGTKLIFIIACLCLAGGFSRTAAQISPASKFEKMVEEKLKTFTTRKMVNNKFKDVRMSLKDVCPLEDRTARRIFADYGAVYIAGGVIPPARCIFSESDQVEKFQTGAASANEMIDGVSITLQKAAMDALLKAREKAALLKLKISPRGGSTAAMRSYEETRTLWNSRFLPGLSYWVKRGRLTKDEAEKAKWLSTSEQVAQVLDWEDNRQLYFSKDFSKSILYSVAAPGASQHISMLALDVEQFSDKRIRNILAEYGWFQTVKSDLPHFTYLGHKESDLEKWGLKKVSVSGQDFWVPDFK